MQRHGSFDDRAKRGGGGSMVRGRHAHLQLKVRLSSAVQQNRASWEARMASQEEDQEWWVSDPVPGPRETRLVSCRRMPLLLVDAMVYGINGTVRGTNACLARAKTVLLIC